jgi:hypothetical protein
MEAAAAVAATRGVALPMPPSQPSRKEWRVVSDNPIRGANNEDLERSKFGQSDERLIYEVRKGSEPADVDFCSITIDASLDNDILQQRLHSVVKQREELQQMEVDLRAQLIARSEIMEMQTSYDSQLKEQANTNVKLQEQLHETEQTLRELERKMDEKERELHAIRIDHEAAWAKEDLLREQNKELATFRRERDNAEAERAQHLKQIHEFQEHIQDKERQFMELQDQNRISQESIMFKDEQLREAQAWISRVQEMDVLQSSTNHNLQAELRERIEQYNQLWLHCQRQYGDMERLQVLIQQLRLELADTRERSGNYSEEQHTSPKEVPHFGQSNGTQLEISGSGVILNGNPESFVSPGTSASQNESVGGVQMAQSLIGMPSYLPPGQVAAVHHHPFVMPPQSHFSHFHSIPALQHWQNQQAASEASQVPNHNQYPSSQSEQNMLRSDASYDYEVSVNGQTLLHSEYLDARSVQPSSNEEAQVLESIDNGYTQVVQPQQALSQISSQFTDVLRLDTHEHNAKTEENNGGTMANHRVEVQGLMMEQTKSGNEIPNNAVVPEVLLVSSGQNSTPILGKASDVTLLDERSLLACIVRTIPPGSNGRIRISSTLPNRLGKMLAPLHWHDYKKKYGKLEDFVASHPEVFVIEEDYIQVREGAQEMIAATSALAKVAAAAAAAATSSSSSYSSKLPSVAVTPMAHQSHRLKKVPSSSKSADNLPIQFSPNKNQHHHSNGGGVQILTKPMELGGANGNGSNPNKSDLGKRPPNFSQKHQGRTNMTSLTSGR